MRLFHIILAGTLATSLLATAAQAGQGGSGGGSIVTCRQGKEPDARAVLAAMWKKWPLNDSLALPEAAAATAERDAQLARIYRAILQYGYKQQHLVDGASAGSRPGGKDPGAGEPLFVDAGYSPSVRSNLGLMFHQFADGTIISDIDKSGFIEWHASDADPKDPAEMNAALGIVKQPIGDRGLTLLRQWAAGFFLSEIKCPGGSGVTLADNSTAPIFLPDKLTDKRLKHAKAAPGYTYLLTNLGGTAADGPSASAGAGSGIRGQKPDGAPALDFYLRGSSASLAQALGDSIVTVIDKGDRPKNSTGDSAASIAFHHDQIDHTANTFTMHLGLGVGFIWDDGKKDDDDADAPGADKPGSAWHLGVVAPYVTADRVNKSSPSAMKNNLTDLGLGGAMILLWHPDKGDTKSQAASIFSEFRFTARVQGDTDDHFGASILYVAAQASAALKAFDCMTAYFPSKDYFFRFSCNYNVDVDYGHIFNAGDFLNLSQKEYARVGGDFSGTIYGPDHADIDTKDMPSWWVFGMDMLSRLSYTASYKALHDFSENHGDLTRFDSSLEFKLTSEGDDGPSTSIALSYTNGKADITLAPQRFWEMQFKASF